MNDIKIGKYLTYLLRHCPESLKLKMDNKGYVSISELIEKLKTTKYKIDIEILDRIVKTDDKQRFSYNEDKTKIRCVQGHSFHVSVAKEGIPPSTLYHGTSIDNLSSIKKNGILKCSRDYVHLSSDKDTAVDVGLRHAKSLDKVIVFKIDTQKMISDGFKFYVAENGVWLIEYIPPQYV